MSEQARSFADQGAKTTREAIEKGNQIREEARRTVEEGYATAMGDLRELSVKLIDMARANTEAAFDLAHQIATAKAPSDIAAVCAAHGKKQIEILSAQTQELTMLGQRQRMAAASTQPLARGLSHAFGRKS